MATIDRFSAAVIAYRQQTLDAIALLERAHPFAALTLACCALDLLSHSLYNPGDKERENAYIRTVRRMEDYKREATAQYVYYLRCGLVHEFRTGGDEDEHISVTVEVDTAPQWDSGTLLISVPHFCRSVRDTFERFFINATAVERQSFAQRAFIYVTPIRGLENLEPGALSTSILTSTNTFTPAASSTSGPPPEDLRFGSR